MSNTTLPHPEADISPDAVITQDDVTFTRKGRSRHSFRQKNRRTISHGRLSHHMQAMHSDVLLEEGEEDEDDMLDSMSPTSTTVDFESSMRSQHPASTPPQMLPSITVSTSHPDNGKDGGGSFMSHSAGEISPTSSERSYKRRFLRKLRLVK